MFLLETARLSLRHIEASDDAFILQLMNEPAYIRNIGDRGIRTTDDARSYISVKFTKSYETLGYGLYLVELKGNPIGIAGFIKRDLLEYPDIGFAFLERFRSHGYAYESAAAVLNYGRNELGFDCVFGIVSPGNLPSISLLEKIGLRFERMIRLPENDKDSMLFSTGRAGDRGKGQGSASDNH